MRTLWAILVAIVVGFVAQAQQQVNNFRVLTNLYVGNAITGLTLNGYNIDAIATNSAANKLDITNGAAVALTGSLTNVTASGHMVLDAQQFGLTPWDYSAAASNWAALTNALGTANRDGYHVVSLPAGWFWISQTLTIPPRLEIVGKGGGRRIDYLNDAAISNAIFNGSLDDLKIAGPTWAATMLAGTTNFVGPMLSFDDSLASLNPFFPTNTLSDGSTVLRYQASVTLKDFGLFGNNLYLTNGWANHGVSFPNVWDLTLENLSFVRIRGHIANLRNVNGLRISGVSSFGSSLYGTKGVFLWDASDYLLDGLYSFGGRGPGIFVASSGGWLSELRSPMIGNFDGYGYKSVTGWASSVATTTAGHELTQGDAIVFYADGGTLPAEIKEGDVYWVATTPTATTFTVNTNHVAAFSGTSIPVTDTVSTTLVSPGPAVGLYLGAGSKLNTVVGGRFDQNYDEGLRIEGGARNTITGTILKENGVTTQTGSVTKRTNTVANVRVRASGLYGAANNSLIGLVHGNSDLPVQLDNAATGTQIVAPALDAGSMDSFGVSYGSGLTSLNYVTVGDTNAGPSLRLIGGVSGAGVLQLYREGSGFIGLGLSGSSSLGSVLSIQDVHANKNIAHFDRRSSGFPVFRAGSYGGDASPLSFEVAGSDATSLTNVSGGGLVVSSGRGRGAGASSTIVLRVPTETTSGTTQQSYINAITINDDSVAIAPQLVTINGAVVPAIADSSALTYSGGTNITVTVPATGAPHVINSLAVTNAAHITLSGNNVKATGEILLTVASGTNSLSFAGNVLKPAATSVPISLTTGTWNLEWKQRSIGGTNFTVLNVLQYDTP